MTSYGWVVVEEVLLHHLMELSHRIHLQQAAAAAVAGVDVVLLINSNNRHLHSPPNLNPLY